MLVLSRKLNQEIQIGENITVTVLKVKGNTVRLGIKAPREIHVVRGEIPKKSEVVGKLASESDTNGESELTVVFTNSDETGSPSVDLIPFQNSCGKNSSIKFEQRLPQVTHHNRLKEIVSQLTQN